MADEPSAVVGLPSRIEAVLLDAGGVLLDLDYGYMCRLIEPRHRPVEPSDLSRAEAHARVEVGRTVRDGARHADAWRDYFHIMLSKVGVPGAQHEPIIDSLSDAHRHVGLWTVPSEGAPETVAELKRRGFRMGVVSNAEGRVAQDLDNAGFRGMFETVVDSHLVGVEKPDPAIFKIALERMALRAEGAIFVGDVPSVDVDGARAAGMTPVLLDRHDMCPEAAVPRLRSIAELPDLLGVRL